MGIVYDVYDRVRGMRVALKALRHVEPAHLYRFKREFRAISSLAHPNIIALYELVAENDECFFTMELVEGVDFLTYVRGHRVLSNPQLGLPRSALGSDSGAALGEAESTVSIMPLRDNTPATPQLGDGLDTPLTQPLGAPVFFLSERMGLPTPPQVRPNIDDLVDLGRLRAGLTQLARALTALHAADLVHRDLKSSNVLVTRDGRIVLTDFGVVAELQQRGDPNLTDMVVGTPVFMAPEQMRGGVPTAAADWYTFGVILYQSLTGVTPYVGSAETVIHAKQVREPLPPEQFCDGIPPSLSQLCIGLLQREPDARPVSAEVLVLLGTSDAASQASLTTRRAQVPFVGRAAELCRLRDARARVQHGQTACLLIHGPPGIGKSALVRSFLDGVRSEHGAGRRVAVLSSRCHQRERMPYQALDGLIDNLCNLLLQMDDSERASVLPEDAWQIATLFPVVRRIPELAVEPEPTGGGTPQQQRRAVAAFKTLIARFIRRVIIVLSIDNLHWADGDSLQLLQSLLSPPMPRGVLIMATLRDDEPGLERDARLGDFLASLERLGICEHMTLGPLTRAEQDELIASALADRVGDATPVDEIARDAAGHPQLLAELLWFLGQPRAVRAGLGSPRLEDILWRRVASLPASARELVEVVAVAGAATPLSVLADALELSDDERERAFMSATVARSLRVTRAEPEPWLEVYHERVRAAASAALPEDVQRDHRRQLVSALERWGQCPAATLAGHLEALGERVRAGLYLIDAAREAAAEGAHARAETMYERTLALLEALSGARDADLGRCRAWLGLVELFRVDERLAEVSGLLDSAQALAEAHEFNEELATIHWLRGSWHFAQGDAEACLEAHQQSRYYAHRAGAREHEARALGGLGDAYFLSGRMRSAYELFNTCVGLCKRHGFRDIEVAHLPMRGAARYFLLDVDGALRDAQLAARMAARAGNREAELLARAGTAGVILMEAGRLDEAKRSFESALELGVELGARRFESLALTGLGRIHALQGDQAKALQLAGQSVERCRQRERSFFGPVALASLALITSNAELRRSCLAEGEAILRGPAPSHAHLYFAYLAMDAAYASESPDEVLRYAGMLAEYTRVEPLPWARFFIERGRALAHHLRDPHDAAACSALRQLRDEASMVGLELAAAALRAGAR